MSAPRTQTREAGAFFGQPPGLATLFGTELWERFSYYGMRTLLVLFLTAAVTDGGLGLSESLAVAIYGVYSAMIYLSALPGGWIADRLLGTRRAVLYGGITIAAGHYCMAVPNTALFFVGLVLIMGGTGLLKPNISATVGQLYGEHDARRDAGFSLFYMGINIGAFLSPIICGWLALKVGWHWGFGAAGVGMTIGLIWYVLGRRHLGDAGIRPGNPATPPERRRALLFALGALALIGAYLGVDAATGGINANLLINLLTVVAVVVPAVYFWNVLRSPQLTGQERGRMRALVWLFLASAVFWMIYDQAGSVLNLFAQDRTQRNLLGLNFPAPWFQSVNPLLIIALAPVFAALWVRLGSRQPSTPAKFVYALVGIGASFLIMSLAAQAAVGGGRVSPLWLLSVYFVQTLSELVLSPTGLSVSTKLAPAAFSGQIMGVWFLSTAVGDAVGGQAARFIGRLSLPTYFLTLGLVAVVVGALLLVGVPRVRKLMGGVE